MTSDAGHNDDASIRSSFNDRTLENARGKGNQNGSCAKLQSDYADAMIHKTVVRSRLSLSRARERTLLDRCDRADGPMTETRIFLPFVVGLASRHDFSRSLGHRARETMPAITSPRQLRLREKFHGAAIRLACASSNKQHSIHLPNRMMT